MGGDSEDGFALAFQMLFCCTDWRTVSQRLSETACSRLNGVSVLRPDSCDIEFLGDTVPHFDLDLLFRYEWRRRCVRCGCPSWRTR